MKKDEKIRMENKREMQKPKVDLCMDKLLDEKLLEVELRREEIEQDSYVQLLDPIGQSASQHGFISQSIQGIQLV